MRIRNEVIVVGALLLLSGDVRAAEIPRVLPEGQRPNDRRLGPLNDLNGNFPFVPPDSPAAWDARAEHVRTQILIALGLWPMPTKTPLNPVVHGKLDRGDYTVEKVYFESMPGFFVTGNLYRPARAAGRHPGVLCPHGHWPNGRFYEKSREEVLREIETGAEQFEEGGRSPLQARCVQLARMGCVVFHYDMLGYADSQQISFEVAHRFAQQRPQMNSKENWGLFSPQAEAHGQSVMGLQTYNSIRALDFLCQLPDVDADRLAATGASGGGTQTFILCAIDPRLAVSFPAVMVSTAMQGGCTCENACLLRIGTGNVEFAGLFAPKPLGMTAADDWTIEMETKGFPQLKQLYQLLGIPESTFLLSRPEFKHNYNSVSRHAMYEWFNRHLKLGLAEPIRERDYQRLSADELTVWTTEHPRPLGGDDFERQLLRWWHDDSQQQLASLASNEVDSRQRYRDIMSGAWNVILGRGLPDSRELPYEEVVKEDRDGYLLMAGLLRNKLHHEELPVMFLHPRQWQGRAVVWLTKRGKSGLLTDNGQPHPHIRRLLADGVSIVGADLLYQGEFLEPDQPFETTRRVDNPREAAAYTFGYNRSVFAQRVHDILSVLSFVAGHELKPRQVDLVGLDGTGPWAAAACSQAGDLLGSVAIDTQGFRFANVVDLHSPDFLPCAAKYGDLPGLLSLANCDKLWICGEPDVPPLLRTDANPITSISKQPMPTDAVDWLLGN